LRLIVLDLKDRADGIDVRRVDRPDKQGIGKMLRPEIGKRIYISFRVAAIGCVQRFLQLSIVRVVCALDELFILSAAAIVEYRHPKSLTIRCHLGDVSFNYGNLDL
jgi:hypothetical protein